MSASHTWIEVPGGTYHCVGQSVVHGYGFTPDVQVVITQKQQGQPDQVYQATADSSGQFFVSVNLGATGNVSFIATVGETYVDRTKATVIDCSV